VSIINLHRVNDQIYRSGQPLVGDIDEAVQLGIKGVIVLNGYIGEFVQACEDRHIVVLQYPITDDQAQGLNGAVLDVRTLDVVDKLLAIPRTGAWLVHCTEGKDRTGIVIARYRVLYEGWTKASAYDEWVTLGSHRYKALEEYWAAWDGVR
jgi:protein tyrosine/serine phosphatase